MEKGQVHNSKLDGIFSPCLRTLYHVFSHDTASLILSTVHLIRLLTVATDPRESFALGAESTKI